MLNIALHSVRSLLCTATNTTPHERFFKHPRRSGNGTSLPTWLLTPGPVLLRSHVRSSKYAPLVEKVHLLEANPKYAHIQFPDGRESTVSLRHLAPCGEAVTSYSDQYTESNPSGPPNTINPLQDIPHSSYNEDAHTPNKTILQKLPMESESCRPPNLTDSPQVDFNLPSKESDSAPSETVDPTLVLRPSRTRRLPSHLSEYIL